MWRSPDGVSPGTWDYVHRRSIADDYDAFIDQTPLCDLDQRWIGQSFPPAASAGVCVADFGAGTGRTTRFLIDRGYRVLAIDLSHSMLLQIASSTDTDRVIADPMRMRANLVQLDGLDDNTMDHGVCLFATLGMIRGRDHRRTFLRHARRIIRPGGRFLLHVHHRWAALTERGGVGRMIQSAVDRRFELGDAVYAYRGIGEMFMHRYGRRELTADLRHAGWTNFDVQRINLRGDGLAKPWQIAGGFFVQSGG